jgi:hypothetical protein
MGKSDSREKLKAKEFEPQRTQREKAGEKVYCCWVQGLVMSGYNVPIAEVDKDRVDWQLRA